MSEGAARAASEVVSAFRRNVVVAASAGTGKTHLLTSLYVMLALGLTSLGQKSDREAHPPLLPKRIIATTFSRAAALEIRSRVERALTLLAEERPDAPFSAEIQARLSLLAAPPSPAELVLRARAAKEGLLRARIDTLHGLASDILRRHALSLGLAPGMRVGEEDLLSEIAESTIEQTLSAALDGEGAEALGARALIVAIGSGERARDALRMFFERLDEEGLEASDLDVTDHQKHSEQLRRDFLAACENIGPGAREKTRAAAQLAAELLRDTPEEDFRAASMADHPALVALFELTKGKNDHERQLFETRDRLPGTRNEKRHSLVSAIAEGRELCERERAVLALLVGLGKRLSDARLSRGVLSFGDLLRIVRVGLRDQPAFAREVRAEIGALLVDEFQDTSAAQRDLVYLLRERDDRASQRPAQQLPTGADVQRHGLFLVGDRKQSIYGFRGADVAVFAAMCAELAGEPATSALELPPSMAGSEPSADFLALSHSRRSAPGIVHFVNAFCRADFASSGPAGSVYSAAEHLVALRPEEGERVLFVAQDDEPVAEPLAQSAGPLRRAFSAAALAHYLTRPDGEAMRPGQIAILPRRRATIGLVELALGKLGLPYVVAGRALYDSSEVRDLAGLLRLVLDPRERHSNVLVLRGPLVGLSDAALLCLAEDDKLREASFAPELLDRRRFPEESVRLENFRARFLAARSAILREPPGRALWILVREFGLDEIIAGLPRAPLRLANLERLVSLARGRGGTLVSFSRWLDRQIDDETDEPEAVVFNAEDDAVRLTTIHGAKGLDFDATIVLDLESIAGNEPGMLTLDRSSSPVRIAMTHRGARGERLGNPTQDIAREANRARAHAERRRLTYVALTRAKRVLGLIGIEGRVPNGSALATFEGSHSELEPLCETLQASDLLREASASAAHKDAQQQHEPASLPVPTFALRTRQKPRRLVLATTPLGVFSQCPRRYRLRFLLGFDEPVGSGQLALFDEPESDERTETEAIDPRSEGRAAHRVLEQFPVERFGDPSLAAEDFESLLLAEGISGARASLLAPSLLGFATSDYAASLAEPGTVLHREEEFVLALDGEVSLFLRGTMDLWVSRPERGLAEIIDYKLTTHARPSAHAFQLLCYALSVSERHPALALRAGIVPLLSGGEPAWLAGEGPEQALSQTTLAAARKQLLDIAQRMAHARAYDEFPSIPERRCREHRCGFVTACHRRTKS